MPVGLPASSLPAPTQLTPSFWDNPAASPARKLEDAEDRMLVHALPADVVPAVGSAARGASLSLTERLARDRRERHDTVLQEMHFELGAIRDRLRQRVNSLLEAARERLAGWLCRGARRRCSVRPK